MKKEMLVFYTIISFLFFISPFAVYFIFFGGIFSPNDQTWANFGSFIGGLTTSIFSYFSFIFILYSLYIEREKNRKVEIDSMFFKYTDMLNNCRANLYVSFGLETKQGQGIITDFNGIVAGIAINPKLKLMLENEKRQKYEIDSIITHCNKYVFYRNAIKPFTNLLKIVLEYIQSQEEEIRNKFLKILVSQLSEQDKMAYGLIHHEEINDPIKNIIFEETIKFEGIKNMAQEVERYLNFYRTITK